MGYIFMDESWCLWFDFTKKKTSKYFVITCLFVDEKRPVEKIIKKIFSNFSKVELKRHTWWEIHCYKEHPKTRTKIFKDISEKNVSVMCIYLNKKKVYTKLQDEKHILYNYVTNILLDRIFTKKLLIWEKFTFVASRRETNKFLNENFRSYIATQMNWFNVWVEIKTSTEEKCLQVVDCLSWGIFRKYEHEDESYYNMFKWIIIEENPLFP